jgi:hypothetical protein
MLRFGQASCASTGLGANAIPSNSAKLEIGFIMFSSWTWSWRSKFFAAGQIQRNFNSLENRRSIRRSPVPTN